MKSIKEKIRVSEKTKSNLKKFGEVGKEGLKIAGYAYVITAAYIGTLVIAACIIADVETEENNNK